MFIREKRIGAYTYVYLVEAVREDGKPKQRIIRNLGRKEDVEAAGDLDRLGAREESASPKSTILHNPGLKEGGGAAGYPDRLARPAARLSQRSIVLSLV